MVSRLGRRAPAKAKKLFRPVSRSGGVLLGMACSPGDLFQARFLGIATANSAYRACFSLILCPLSIAASAAAGLAQPGATRWQRDLFPLKICAALSS
jgi:hypothetical protein